jgi:hypothetical protein
MRIEKDNQSVYLGAEIVIIFFREGGKMMSLIFRNDENYLKRSISTI